MKVSVVIANYNRAEFLWRALACYKKQSFPLEDIEFIYVEDWSDDGSDSLLSTWAQELNITVIRPPYKQPGTWRSEASIINIGLRAAKGEFIIATHPEVMCGRDSIRSMYEHRQENTYHACKIYFLTPEQQEQLPFMKWEEDVLNVRQIPGFYESEPAIKGYNDHYKHINMEAHTRFDSWVFGGMTRKTWQAIGGLTEFDTWGSVDVDFAQRRTILQIPNITEMDEQTMCVHQNHDALSAQHRDIDAVLKSIRIYPTPGSAILDNL
jgi:hypothetical protein